ncbi:chemotaxis protein CheC [Keratinibaculum paraultunense]|uniref:Chemotaxis protein CheC n=1 Tax=Keratinibaculum paraultunense TaxID=1278232 RepID=A0A4R3KZQ6_9FIRM|nr:chemotaxis protein CheC [Keratinibaculum paraultunense]QQY78939.1 hypothetical protein JL105_07000 [Keratinibaculum paraultunense]TCS90556.1 chemotaxis protein CheC [Keratinibaculum paraultunense]
MYKNSLMYDVLREIFNIGVGKAASMLSEIVDKRIMLDIPNIIILGSEEKEEITKHFSSLPQGALMISSIKFGDRLTGEANLLFPANKMRTFVNLCMDQPEYIEGDNLVFTDMDLDVIREIGNIMLNSIIGEIGNILDVSLKYTLPKVKIFDKDNLKNDIKSKEEFCILLLYVTFVIADVKIEGAIIIDLTLDSLKELQKMINKMEDDLNG